MRNPVAEQAAPRLKNYITPSGLQRLIDERKFLLTRERPAVTQGVAWAAGHGDRAPPWPLWQPSCRRGMSR
jgi:transcription elongation factor GreB